MREDNPILEAVRGFDHVAAKAWGIVKLSTKIVRNAVGIWRRSPWLYATGAAIMFASAAIGRGTPWAVYVVGLLWLYQAVARAVRGPSYTVLGRHDPAARGFFRIRLATIALLVALLSNHSDFDAFTSIAYFLFAVILLLGLDRDVRG